MCAVRAVFATCAHRYWLQFVDVLWLLSLYHYDGIWYCYEQLITSNNNLFSHCCTVMYPWVLECPPVAAYWYPCLYRNISPLPLWLYASTLTGQAHEEYGTVSNRMHRIGNVNILLYKSLLIFIDQTGIYMIIISYMSMRVVRKMNI